MEALKDTKGKNWLYIKIFEKNGLKKRKRVKIEPERNLWMRVFNPQMVCAQYKDKKSSL